MLKAKTVMTLLDYRVPTNQNILYWIYHDGLMVLSSHEDYRASAKILKVDNPPSLWNQTSGYIDYDNAGFAFSKEYQNDRLKIRSLVDIRELHEVIRILEEEVDGHHSGGFNTYQLNGTPVGFPAKTILQLKQLRDPRDVLYSDEPLVVYHGTSLERWNLIQQEGLVAGRVKKKYNDLLEQYSEDNLYLATQPWVASFYAKRQALKDHCRDFVVLKINLPDKTKVFADDYIVQRFCPEGFERLRHHGQRRDLIEEGMGLKGELAYRGNIGIEDIAVYQTGKVAKNIPIPNWPIPKSFYLPIEVFANTGEHLMASRLTDYRFGEDYASLGRIFHSYNLRPKVLLHTEFSWDNEIPDGYIEVFPDSVTAHDSLWLDAIRNHLHHAIPLHDMMKSYLDGQPSCETPDWHYLTSYVAVPKIKLELPAYR